MCNPTLLFATSAAVGVGAAVTGGLAQSAAAKTDAKVARINERAALDQAAADEAMQRRAAAKTIGQSRVDFGMAGVTRSGTALDILEQQAQEAELDALKIRAGGDNEAVNYRNQQRSAKKAKGAAMVGAGINSVNSMLSGASSWQQYESDQALLKAGVP